MDPGDALRRTMARQDLSREETEELFGRLMDGALADAYKAALLVALAMKGETASEIAGAAAAMRRRVVPIPHRRERVVDTCGTGGDGRGTFNISTAAALVAAAAGVPIAKHGNRSVSSRSGSADVLEALEVPIDAEPATAARTLDDLGIAFLFAPRHHGAMKHAIGPRREMAVRTVFNVLGPLTNPAGARRQVVGVYDRALVEIIGRVLLDLGSEHALVVHGDDGLDEITTTGTTLVAEARGGALSLYELDPEVFGVPRAAPEDLRGGTPRENAERLREVVAGREGPLADVTALNAGAALYVGGQVEDLRAGYASARETLASGAAARKLAELRQRAESRS